MRVIVSVIARQEPRKAIRWYQTENPQVAARFRSAFREALSLLAEAPLRWAELVPGVRRYLLPRYPYMLLYAIRGERVLVLRLLHHARHPATWRRGP